MNIGGKQREAQVEFQKKVGLFEADVVAINPTKEELEKLRGVELKEDSKETEYLGEREGNTTFRVDVHLKEKKEGDIFKVSFFLSDEERENKEGTKNQYINSVGICSWADDPNNLAEWFTKDRTYRVAYSGEEELYNFLRMWLNKLDYRHAETTLELDWKRLMRGDVRDLRAQIDGEWCGSVGALATVAIKERDGETREYQGVYNKAFLPPYSLKHFRLIDYSDPNVIEGLSKKETKKLKAHEKFVMNVIGEYGCKDFYIFKDLQNYDPEMNFVSSNDAIADTDASY